MWGRTVARSLTVGLLVVACSGGGDDDERRAERADDNRPPSTRAIEDDPTRSTLQVSAQQGGPSSTFSSATTTEAGSSPSPSSSESSSSSERSPTSVGDETVATTGSTAGRGDSPPCSTGTTHCVGPGQEIRTLAAAVAVAGDGAVIELLPGRYNETVAVAADNITIRSRAGNRAIVDCGGMRPAGGKACILAVGTNLTVEHLVVTGARGPDDNEACFRNEPGTRFVVRGVECHGSNNGILGSGGSWLIEDSFFHGNGAGDGLSHNLYLSGDCSEVVFRRSRSLNAVGGHAFKSRCRTSTIEASELVDNTVADAAEFSNGGQVVIRNSTIRQPDGPNGNIVRHGAEGCSHPGTLTFVGTVVQSARSASYIRSECGPITLTDTPLPAGVEVVAPS